MYLLELGFTIDTLLIEGRKEENTEGEKQITMRKTEEETKNHTLNHVPKEIFYNT